MINNEKDKFLKWERLTVTQQHMILMYFYRVETEPVEELENYIETSKFRQYGIKRSDLPSWHQNLHAEKLREVAYSVINTPLPLFMTQDFSGYLPSETI